MVEKAKLSPEIRAMVDECAIGMSRRPKAYVVIQAFDEGSMV